MNLGVGHPRGPSRPGSTKKRKNPLLTGYRAMRTKIKKAGDRSEKRSLHDETMWRHW